MHLVQVYEPEFLRSSPAENGNAATSENSHQHQDMLLDEQAHKSIPMNLTVGSWPWAEDALCSPDHSICKDHPSASRLLHELERKKAISGPHVS